MKTQTLGRPALNSNPQDLVDCLSDLAAIPENEATQLMCGSCKMSMPGLQKLQQQLRKEKRKDLVDFS